MTRLLLSLSFLVFLLAPIFGQSLYEDAIRLVESRNALMKDSSAGLQNQKEPLADIMAVLQHYDEGYTDEALVGSRLLEVPLHYADNELLSNWLPMESLNRVKPLLRDSQFAAKFLRTSDSLRSPKRQRMIKLMVGPHSSPAEYLSVSRTLQEYTVPPVSSKVYLEAAAQESNRNLEEGLLSTEALLEGLFRFVVERAQQELAISFMDRFLEDEVPPVKMLFPNVFEEVKSVGFDYSHSYLERIRASFYEDFQLLSVRLPTVLLEEKRFESLQRNPLIYNLLATYSIIGMSQNGLPTDEIMAVTHRNLFENYRQNEKRRNFTVASKGKGGTDYAALSDSAAAIYNQIKVVYDRLNQAENELEDKLDGLVRRNSQQSNPAPVPAFDRMFEKGYQLAALLGQDQDYPLSFLPHLLRGELDEEYILSLRSVESFDRYFGKTYTEQELRAAGLEIARQLYSGNWYQNRGIGDLLESWLEDLILYDRELDAWHYSLFPEDTLLSSLKDIREAQQRLNETIKAVEQEWGPEQLSQQQKLAFGVLKGITGNTLKYRDPALDLQVGNIIDKEFNGDDTKKRQATSLFLERGWKELEAVEERLIRLHNRLLAESDQEAKDSSALAKYLESSIAAPAYQRIRWSIKKLRRQLRGLQTKIDSVDQNYALTECQLLKNAEPMLFLTESLSQMMYCLSAPGDNRRWLSLQQLDTVMNDDQLRPVFLGLLYQRLRTIKQFRQLSPPGLAQLVQLTVADLPKLEPVDSMASAAADSLAFQRKASFVVNTLSRLVEIPILAAPTASGQTLSLAQQYPPLQYTPAVAGNVTDFIYHINNKNHRRAVGSLLGLFQNVQAFVTELQSDKDEVSETIRFLNKYGFFVAGLVDARSGQEVSSLLNNVSEPPGSSRLKRRAPFSISLNAYLGASFGYERWDDPQMDIEEDFWNLAPTLPLGASFSFLAGPGQPAVYDDEGELVKTAKRPASFSIFAGIIDLGSLLNYRFEEEELGNTDLTFKNMFKPSLQFHYNFPRSPFYIGTGIQYGPHYREINEMQEPLRSVRAFISAGLDIPLKTLYMK